MLIKKKLLELPITPAWRVRAGSDYNYKCAAASYADDVMGDVLALDIYNKKGELRYRFFCDKKNCITYSTDSKTWDDQTLYNKMYYSYCASSKDTDAVAAEFFGNNFGRDAFTICSEFQYDRIYERKQAAYDRRLRLRNERLKIFSNPEDDLELREYINAILPRYIFVGNSINKQRSAHCQSCGADYTIPSGEFKSKAPARCPTCGADAIYLHERYKWGKEEKTYICTVEKHMNRTLICWMRVYRRFVKPYKEHTDDTLYRFEPYHWTIGAENAKSFEWAYKVRTNHGVTDIKSTPWVEPCESYSSYLYYKNIAECSGLHERVEQLLRDKPAKMSPFAILNDYSEFPQMEYLLKLGLTELAGHIRSMCSNNARGFTEVTGVSKQLLPLYRKYNVTYAENRFIKDLNCYCDEELFLKIRKLQLGRYSNEYQTIKSRWLANIGDKKLINYIYKFLSRYKKTMVFFQSIYSDYRNMLEDLNITELSKSDLLPADLLGVHDRLSERLTAEKAAIKKEEFDKGVSTLYKQIPDGFANESYCIVLPRSHEDFVHEGQALGICVGNGSYEKRHIANTSLICFIRNKKEPDKSYICCEIEMSSCRVLQVHGYKNDISKALPADVKRFAEKYASAIKKIKKEGLKTA